MLMCAIERGREQLKVAVRCEGEPLVHCRLKFGTAGASRQSGNRHLLPSPSAIETDASDHTSQWALGPNRDHVLRVSWIHGQMRLEFRIVGEGPGPKSARLTAGPRACAGELPERAAREIGG